MPHYKLIIKITCVLLILLTSYTSYAEDNDKANNAKPVLDVHFRNAYEIANAIYTIKYFDWKSDITSQERYYDTVVSSLMWYIQAKNLGALKDSLKNYAYLKSYIDTMTNRYYKITEIYDWKHSKIDSYKTQFEGNNNITTYLEKLKEWKNKKRSFCSLKKHNQICYNELQDQDLIKQMIIHPDNSEFKNQLINILTEIVIAEREIKEVEIKLGKLENYLESEILTDSLYPLLKKINYNFFLSKNQSPNIIISNIRRTVTQEGIEYQQKALLEIQGEMPALKLGMPSEAEMIDALAIYLAKRVKQEAVLWFFETMRKNAEVYELVHICFPATLELLNGSELYEVPNLGSTWRYALAKDFVHLPEHVFASDWLKEKSFVDEHVLADLVLTTTIYRLMQQDYSYTDLVKYLYLNNGDSEKGKLQSMINILYAFNNELVVQADSTKKIDAHFLQYEEIRNMPDEAFYMMLELIDLRYERSLSNVLGNKLLLSTHGAELKKWIGKVELAISQYHQVKKQYSLLLEKNADKNEAEKVAYTFKSTWKLTSELFTAIVPDENVFKDTGIFNEIDQALYYVNKTQEIYEQLEQKNFSGAVINTMDIVDTLTNYNRKDVVSFIAYIQGKAGNYSTVPIGKYEELPKVYREMYLKYIQKIQEVKLCLNEYGGIEDLLKTTNSTDNDIIVKYHNIPIIFKNNAGKYIINKNYKSITVASKCIDTILIYMKDTFDNYEELRNSFLAKYNKMIQTYIIDNDRNGITEYIQYYYRGKYDNAINTVTRMAAFLNDVSRSHDSKQLATVIESYAMPTGSYKRKRSMWNSLDLNAYVGVFTGYEYPVIKGEPLGSDSSHALSGGAYGVTAPIGITWSKTFGVPKNAAEDNASYTYTKSSYNNYWRKSKSTLSIGLSIVDIGAVVAYRFSNTGDVLPHEFKWEQFISPGLHIAYGIPNTPLVFSFSTVYTPKIRRVEIGTDTEQLNAIRIQGGILFDIPLFNLWERKSITRMKGIDDKNDIFRAIFCW